MNCGMIGKKSGMTRIFHESGVSVPVTVVQILENKILQVKTKASDGYCAIQVGVGVKKEKNSNMAMIGHCKKAGCEVARFVREFRISDEKSLVDSHKTGDVLDISRFKVGDIVSVVGTSKGKGFAGVIKRHNFKMQSASHGNSLAHRAGGSYGQCQTPGRVFKGKKMPGHMGAERCTVKGQRIVDVDKERGVILIKGSAPGFNGAYVMLFKTSSNVA